MHVSEQSGQSLIFFCNVSTPRGLLQATRNWTHSLQNRPSLFCVVCSVLCIQRLPRLFSLKIETVIVLVVFFPSLTRVGFIHFCNHLLELQVGLSLAQLLHHSLQLHYVYTNTTKYGSYSDSLSGCCHSQIAIVQISLFVQSLLTYVTRVVFIKLHELFCEKERHG